MEMAIVSSIKEFPTRDIEILKEIARTLRIDILVMLNRAASGHTGGSLSIVELITALFFSKMHHRADVPKMQDRDRFILSKGHGAPALYAALALSGYFSREHLMTLRRLGSPLQGHPDMLSTKGIEMSSGSLGQGLSIANGIAMGLKLDKSNARVYALMGDGELQEGQIWEAAMSAAHYKLDNLCGIVDDNNLQIDGKVADVMGVEPIADKWKAFGWNVMEIDGHDFKEILEAMDQAEECKGKPSLIIAHTIKGKGVSIFEGKLEYHGVGPNDEELEKALKELGVPPRKTPKKPKAG